MVSAANIQAKIENKIFVDLGSTCLLTSTVATSLTEWGDIVPTTPTARSVTFVPWNVVNPKQEFYAFGDLQQGDMLAAFRYTETLAIGYIVQFLSSSYVIMGIEKFPLQDEVLVQVAQLRKKLEQA